MTIKSVEMKKEESAPKKIRKAIFAMVKDGRLVGFMPGTDIEGDPTSTKARMNEWAEKAPGRQVIELQSPPASENMVLEDGRLRQMTKEEIDAENASADQKENHAWAARRALLASIKQKTGLTDAEMTLIVPGYPDWSKPKGGK